MPSRQEMIAALRGEAPKIDQSPSREEMLAVLRGEPPKEQPKEDMGLLEQAYSKAEDIGTGALGILGSAYAHTLGKVSEATEPYIQTPLRGLVAGAVGQQAPTEGETLKDVAERAGISKKPLSEYIPSAFSETGEGFKLQKGGILDVSPAGLVGGAGEMAIDPMTYAIPAAGKGIEKATQGIGGAYTKAASQLSGVSEKNISTLLNKYPELESKIQKYGTDNFRYAEDLKDSLNKAISNTRKQANAKLESAIEKLPTDASESIADMSSDLMSKMNKKGLTPLDIEGLKNIDEIMARYVQGPNAEIAPDKLLSLQRELREAAKPSYIKNGTIFQRGDLESKVAKEMAAKATDKLNKISPEIKAANAPLSELHKIEDIANKNIFKEGTSTAALTSAGAGTSPQNTEILKRLEKVTGYPALKEAEMLSAHNQFANPDWLPKDLTGKATARLAAAGGAGAAASAVDPVFGLITGTLGYGLSNPAAIKQTARALNTLPGRGLSKTVGLLGRKNVARAGLLSGAAQEKAKK